MAAELSSGPSTSEPFQARGGGCCQSQDPHQNISPLLLPPKISCRAPTGTQRQGAPSVPVAGGVPEQQGRFQRVAEESPEVGGEPKLHPNLEEEK